MAITTNGLTIERYNDILNITSQKLNNALGGRLDFTVNSLIGQLTKIFSLTSSEVWEYLQALYDSIDVNTAPDIYLENLALLVGYVRLQATHTRGTEWFIGSEGVLVPQGFLLKTSKGDEFIVKEPFTISSVNSLQTRVYVNDLHASTTYSISIGQTIYNYVSTAKPTEEQILKELQALVVVDGELNFDTTKVYKDENGYDYLLIDKADKTSPMSVAASTHLLFDQVMTPTEIQAVETGIVPAQVNNVSNMVEPLSGITSVYNPEDLKLGRDTETDSEFRDRIKSSYFRTSGGTPDALHRAVSLVEGVKSVKVKENRDFVVDGNGLPPKSVKIIVNGGKTQDIVEAIWLNKSAGTMIWSDFNSPLTVKSTFVDYNEQEHFLRFTRPTTKYCWVKVEYSKYTDDGLEIFPVDGEEIMRQEISELGKLNPIGGDLIPKRYYKQIYNNVQGVNNLVIKFALTDTLQIPPTDNDFTENRIAVSDEEIIDFSPSPIRIVVIYNQNL